MASRPTVIRLIEEIGEQVRETGALDDFAQEVVDALGRSVGFEHCAILIRQAGGGLEPLALSRPNGTSESLEADRTYVRERVADTLQGLTGWVADSGESVRLGDVRDDPRYIEMRDDIRSELCVPIRVARRTLGVVNTETRRSRAYTKHDQSLLEVIAIELAAVLQTSRLGPRLDAADHPVTLCSSCKQYRADDGTWRRVEELLGRPGRTYVSHGVCPRCLRTWDRPEGGRPLDDPWHRR